MIKITPILFSCLLFAASCQQNEACECLAENIRVMKAFRLKKYKGKCEKTGAMCEPFRGTTQADFRNFDRQTKECGRYNELKREVSLMQAYFRKEQENQAEKMQEILRKEMESLEKTP